MRLSTGENKISTLSPETLNESKPGYLYSWARDNSSLLIEAIKTNGVLLLRGFELDKKEDFAAALEAVGVVRKKYVAGNNLRNELADRIYNSTSYPKSWKITLHSEMSHLLSVPKTVSLFCIQPPTISGGETAVASTQEILKAMPEAVLSELKAKKVTYIQRMSDKNSENFKFGRTWQDVFISDDPKFVEDYCRDNSIEASWEENNTLVAKFTRPATIAHPERGHEIWFNQAEQWHNSNLEAQTRLLLQKKLGEGKFPHHARFGNGEEFDTRQLEMIRETYVKQTWLHRWKKSDLLIIHNFSMAHGRAPFEGDRLLLFAMGDY